MPRLVVEAIGLVLFVALILALAWLLASHAYAPEKPTGKGGIVIEKHRVTGRVWKLKANSSIGFSEETFVLVVEDWSGVGWNKEVSRKEWIKTRLLDTVALD